MGGDDIGVFFFVFAGIAGLVLVVLAILVPVNVYLAQKNAYKCFGELQDLNAGLGVLHADLKTLNKSAGLLAEAQAWRGLPELKSTDSE